VFDPRRILNRFRTRAGNRDHRQGDFLKEYIDLSRRAFPVPEDFRNLIEGIIGAASPGLCKHYQIPQFRFALINSTDQRIEVIDRSGQHFMIYDLSYIQLLQMLRLWLSDYGEGIKGTEFLHEMITYQFATIAFNTGANSQFETLFSSVDWSSGFKPALYKFSDNILQGVRPAALTADVLFVLFHEYAHLIYKTRPDSLDAEINTLLDFIIHFDLEATTGNNFFADLLAEETDADFAAALNSNRPDLKELYRKVKEDQIVREEVACDFLAMSIMISTYFIDFHFSPSEIYGVVKAATSIFALSLLFKMLCRRTYTFTYTDVESVSVNDRLYNAPENILTTSREHLCGKLLPLLICRMTGATTEMLLDAAAQSEFELFSFRYFKIFYAYAKKKGIKVGLDPSTESYRRCYKENLSRNFGERALIEEASGRLEEAMALYKKEEALCLELGNKEGVSRTYGNQALILQEWGRLEEAFELFQKQEALFLELGNKDSLLRTYGNQALILSAWGRLDDAMALHKNVEALCFELGNRDGLSRTYGNQAVILKEWGRLEEAFGLFQKAEALCLDLGDKALLQVNYGYQALILSAWGRLDDAMALHKKVEALCLELGRKDGLQGSYGNQAVILRAWGRLDEALALLGKQELLCMELGNWSSLAHCYTNRGLLARDRHDPNTEREMLATALDIFTKLNMSRERDAVRAELEKAVAAGSAT
jgi:tetratricopeptide (TPR) repeat protein